MLGITGLAINESRRDLHICVINFDVLDAAGVKVSSAFASTTDLNAGQSWRFQAVFANPYSVSFKSVMPGELMAM